MDTSLLKSDIFFVVSTTAIIIVTLLVIIGLGYILNILNILRNVSKKAEEGASVVIEGLSEAKSSMHKDGYLLSSLLDLFRRLFTSKQAKTKAKRGTR